MRKGLGPAPHPGITETRAYSWRIQGNLEISGTEAHIFMPMPTTSMAPLLLGICLFLTCYHCLLVLFSFLHLDFCLTHNCLPCDFALPDRAHEAPLYLKASFRLQLYTSNSVSQSTSPGEVMRFFLLTFSHRSTAQISNWSAGPMPTFCPISC